MALEKLNYNLILLIIKAKNKNKAKNEVKNKAKNCGSNISQ